MVTLYAIVKVFNVIESLSVTIRSNYYNTHTIFIDVPRGRGLSVVGAVINISSVSSVAPLAVVPSSDHAKTAKYVCEKCGVTFGRWESLQYHVRSFCNHSSHSRSSSSSSSSSRGRSRRATYTCKKCGRNFNTRKEMFRHAGTACTDVNEPPLPKESKWKHTTPHPLVTEEDPIEPPARFPFSDTLSTELLDVVREH